MKYRLNQSGESHAVPWGQVDMQMDGHDKANRSFSQLSRFSA
jgi:hypothetical protein